MTSITVRKRLTQIFFLAAFCFLLLVARLVWLQLISGDELERSAWENRLREIKLEARRGDICDRNGKVLVTSVSCDSVGAMPVQVVNPRETAAQLARVLGMDEEKVYQR
ncbi:MAG: stage V sporulation protein D, partial [Thermoanaerobacteraceae bacterium]|nr:stage V sporulation protein D [Thermoanaerobacteraceae bacterium]